MKAYKGFNKDMTCRGFQFEEGKEYVTDNAVLCKEGFHACENPLDCFEYYDPAHSVYHEVELEDVSNERHTDDTKIVGKKIKIGARLSVAKICKLHFDYVKSHTTNEKTDLIAAAAGENGSASAGYKGSASAGDWGSASAGYKGSASAGDCGVSASRGSSSSGNHGVSVARCRDAQVKGGKGALLVIAKEDDDCKIEQYAVAVVDGEKIKADVWYELDENGEFKEAEK